MPPRELIIDNGNTFSLNVQFIMVAAPSTILERDLFLFLSNVQFIISLSSTTKHPSFSLKIQSITSEPTAPINIAPLQAL